LAAINTWRPAAPLTAKMAHFLAATNTWGDRWAVVTKWPKRDTCFAMGPFLKSGAADS
jgi:hypothetical protein